MKRARRKRGPALPVIPGVSRQLVWQRMKLAAGKCPKCGKSLDDDARLLGLKACTHCQGSYKVRRVGRNKYLALWRTAMIDLVKEGLATGRSRHAAFKRTAELYGCTIETVSKAWKTRTED